MDLFNLIRAPNPTKVKIKSRPRAPNEVPLLTLTAPPSYRDGRRGRSDRLAEEVAAADPPTVAESRKRGRDGIDVNAPPNVLRRDHADSRSMGEKVLLPYNWVWRQLTLLPCLKMRLRASSQGTAAAGDPNSENASSPLAVGSPKSIYRPKWGVVNGSLLDTPEVCQDLVDHVAPPGYFFELRHLHNDEFLRRYNVNLARQVAMGSQLCLRFEQEAKLLRKSVAQVARRDKRIQAREQEIKNLKSLLEAETNTKKVAKDKSAGLSQELESMRAQFSDLQVSNERLSQQVATLQQQVFGEEKLKASFEEFKRQQDDRVEQRCRGLRLAVMKCGESLELRQAFADVVSAGIAKGLSEGLRHGLEHGQAQLSLESIEAYDPVAEAKFVAALQALKDLKYPLMDQLEGLKDTPMDVIMAALYLESDTGDDAP
nr:hypothetical protein [Tanacetum cinerariifolium]